MSGKEKITKWGGKRAGAGRKPKYMSTDYQIRQMMRTARRKARETGKTLDDVILEIAYGEIKGVTVANQIAAIRLFKENTMAKRSEQDIHVTKKSGPVIGLPPIKGEDPALKIVGGKDVDSKKNKSDAD